MDTGLTEFGRLRGAGLSRQLPRADLEERLAYRLRATNVCVLATCAGDEPRATPIEYYADGLNLYVAASRGTKVPNLEVNPRVSVAICNTCYTDWTDWHTVVGIQITARPELLRYATHPEAYVAALAIYDWRKYRRALGKPDVEPRNTTLIKLTPMRIEYRDLGLLREGFAAVQIWKDGGNDA